MWPPLVTPDTMKIGREAKKNGPLSLHPLKPEEALRAVLRVKSERAGAKEKGRPR